MNKKRWIMFLGLIGVYLAVTCVVTCMARSDYNRVKQGKKPRFTWSEQGYADGGTVEYIGFMYRILSHHGYSKAPRPKWADSDGWAYDVGPELIYFPFICPWWRNKSEITTVVDEEQRIRQEASNKAREQSLLNLTCQQVIIKLGEPKGRQVHAYTCPPMDTAEDRRKFWTGTPQVDLIYNDIIVTIDGMDTVIKVRDAKTHTVIEQNQTRH